MFFEFFLRITIVNLFENLNIESDKKDNFNETGNNV